MPEYLQCGSAEVLTIVGTVSAVVHILVRVLAYYYQKHVDLLLNVMLAVNVALLVYFGYCLFKDSTGKKD